MIKFYRGLWSSLSAQAQNKNDSNGIYFIEDRQILMMGGQEYGKDTGVVKPILTTNGGLEHSGSADVASGTLFAFQGDQSLHMYEGNSTWERIFDPTLSSAAFAVDISGGTNTVMDFAAAAKTSGDSYQATAKDVVDAVTGLESKVSAAYASGQTLTSGSVVSGVNNIVLSKDGGITKSEFTTLQDKSLINVVTAGSGTTTRNAEGTLSTRLVTYKTLAEQTDDILANGLEIRKLANGDTGYEEGYRSQYALYNKQTGLQLGTRIDLVKDQFLKSADYIIGVESANKVYEYVSGTSTTSGYYLSGIVAAENKLEAAKTPEDKDSADRFLKLVFALTNKTDDGAPVAGENDSYVYINVNELFDNYEGWSGVAIDQRTNIVSGVIDTRVNEARKTASDGNYLKLTVGDNLSTGTGLNGFYITGIKEDIKAYIQDLSGVSVNGVEGTKTAINQNTSLSGNGKFLTMVGVDSTGALTGQMASAFASDVNFNALTSSDTAGVVVDASNVQDAIKSVATTIGNLEYTYNGVGGSGAVTKPTSVSSDTAFIFAINQVDGKIATSAMTIDTDNLKATSVSGVMHSYTKEIKPDIDGVQAGGNIGRIYFGSQENNTTKISIQTALTDIINSVNTYVGALDLAATGTSGNVDETDNAIYVAGQGQNKPIANTFVRHIEQEDGLVNVEMMDLTAQNTAFSGIVGKKGAAMPETWDVTSTGYIPVNGYNVGAALSSISNYIGNLDYAATPTGTAVPQDGTTNAYKVVFSVKQDNGQLSAATLDLTAANVEANAVAAVATGANTDVRVALTAGTVQGAIEKLSNLIADYGSFHDVAGNII